MSESKNLSMEAFIEELKQELSNLKADVQRLERERRCLEKQLVLLRGILIEGIKG